MFNADGDTPNLFATAIGRDFCADLVSGLVGRLDGQPPEAIARVRIFVANGRMERRLRALFAARGAGFLPHIQPVQALSTQGALAGIPPAVSPLALRLELADLISRLLERSPDLAPRSALYDLADSLADLMGELFEEGVSPDVIADLNVGDHSQHWARAQAFLGAVAHYFQGDAPLTTEARQSLVVDHLIRSWRHAPPRDPVLVAGSTGSRGATFRLMEAVARLPNGATILPGLDRDMPRAVWGRLLQDRREGLAGEDHPQFRLAKLADVLDLAPWDIPDWHQAVPKTSARVRAVSLALRPAPVTNQWRSEGPKLEELDHAFEPVSLIEAPSAQLEATAIALRLRKAAEDGQRAALISPDPKLTRQVTAALDRWGILPDDSAGQPLSQVAGGRLFRHVADAMAAPMQAELLLTILKHPLCHAAGERGPHLKRTRDLELDVLRDGAVLSQGNGVRAWAAERTDDVGAMAWADWVVDSLLHLDPGAHLSLTDRVARHIALTETLVTGSDGSSADALYAGEDGAALRRLMDELTAAATSGGAMSALDYRDFFTALADDREARKSLRPHADILIWGTQEARVQGADLMILAGLNEGTWPKPASADPWLNRAMRAEAGLRLPDRVTGLAAHDFQQAIAAPEVLLTRSLRDDETDTVPARWLNRLTNLLHGSGSTARGVLSDMRKRGQAYVAMAATLTRTIAADAPAPRPAPCPPQIARPTKLSVTQVEKLIRDPYAVYAARVLGLYPLKPLRSTPDAALRGTALHDVMHAFVAATIDTLPDSKASFAILMAATDDVLAQTAPWPAARRLWRARIAQVAEHIYQSEIGRRHIGTPTLLEAKAEWEVPGTGVVLRGTADRIDTLHGGGYAIYDYKTGAPPTAKQERAFNKQLWLEALMLAGGAFALTGDLQTHRIAYIGLGTNPKTMQHDPAPADLRLIGTQLRDRLLHMRAPDTGFPARRAMQGVWFSGDYDHLARFGEWDETDAAILIPVGGAR